MKKSRFTEEQIAYALKQAELGTTVGEICRKVGVAEGVACGRHRVARVRREHGLRYGPTQVTREGRFSCLGRETHALRAYLRGGRKLPPRKAKRS